MTPSRVFSLALPLLILAATINQAADTPPPPWSYDFAIALELATYQTINDGVILYNGNDPTGCYRMFQGSLKALVPFLKEYPAYEKPVLAALAKAETLPSVTERALELRKPLDMLLEASRRRPEKRLIPPPVVVNTPPIPTAPAPTEAPKPPPVVAEAPKPVMPAEASKPATIAETPKPAVAIVTNTPKPIMPAEPATVEVTPVVPKPSETPEPKPAEPSKPDAVVTKPDAPAAPPPAPAAEIDPKLSVSERMRLELLAARAEPKNTTLWKRLGGIDKIKPIVQDFLFKAANDPLVNFSRDGKYSTDDKAMLKVEQSFIEFLSSRTGGPLEYKGQTMTNAHVTMEITESEFKAMMSDLHDVLEVHHVGVAETNDLTALLNKFKMQIVTAREKAKSPE